MQRNELLSLLSSVGISVDKVIYNGDQAPLSKSGLDSLKVVQLLTALEETIGITVPDQFFEYRHFETIESLENLIQNLENLRA